MVLAISHRFTEVDRAPEYYRQTTMLLALYTGFEISERVLKYEDYVIECLFGQVKKMSLDAAVHPDLKLLIQYDARNKTEYFRTLKIYIESGRHAGRSIEKLHIHKSTFFYRLGKISGILGTALDEGEKLFQYETGIKLLNMK